MNEIESHGFIVFAPEYRGYHGIQRDRFWHCGNAYYQALEADLETRIATLYGQLEDPGLFGLLTTELNVARELLAFEQVSSPASELLAVYAPSLSEQVPARTHLVDATPLGFDVVEIASMSYLYDLCDSGVPWPRSNMWGLANAESEVQQVLEFHQQVASKVHGVPRGYGPEAVQLWRVH